MPKLSIVVPVYKVEPYIHKCVDSILSQTFSDFELILVDDGSPDKCGVICDEYARKDNRIIVIHQDNNGVSAARNIGLNSARGKYISFIDPDDWIDSDMYDECLEYMESNNLDVCVFDVCEVNKTRRFIKYKFEKNIIFQDKEALEKILIDEIDNSPCNKIYKSKTWKNVRFPIGRRFEDVATIYKTFYNAERVGYLRKAYYFYLKREGSAIALSFDAQRRYECFLGYRERKDFALEHCATAYEKCKMFAVKAAISCFTALSAGAGSISIEHKKDIIKFCKNNTNVKYLNGKNKVLLWGIKNFNFINKIYGFISFYSKKMI